MKAAGVCLGSYEYERGWVYYKNINHNVMHFEIGNAQVGNPSERAASSLTNLLLPFFKMNYI